MAWKNFPCPKGDCFLDNYADKPERGPVVKKQWNPRRPNANIMRKFLGLITPVLEGHAFSDEDAAVVRIVLASLTEDSAKEGNNG